MLEYNSQFNGVSSPDGFWLVIKKYAKNINSMNVCPGIGRFVIRVGRYISGNVPIAFVIGQEERIGFIV